MENLISSDYTDQTIFSIIEIVRKISEYLDFESDLLKLMFLNKYFYKSIKDHELFDVFKKFMTTMKKRGISRDKITYIYYYGCLEGEYINFLDACRYGYLLIAEYYYNKYPINIHAGGDIAFRTACKCGQIDIAKWLYQKSKEKSSPTKINANYVFELACTNGHTETAVWLYQLSIDISLPIDIHANNDEGFIATCKNGHTKTVVWLFEISNKISLPFHIDTLNKASRKARNNGHADIVNLIDIVVNS